MATKFCTSCLEIEEEEDFPLIKSRGKAGGRRRGPVCMECLRKKMRGTRSAPKMPHLQTEIARLREAQAGCCAICKVHESELPRALCLDHCHETDKVRGLICSRCNIGLGHFRDSIPALEAAIAYLREDYSQALVYTRVSIKPETL